MESLSILEPIIFTANTANSEAPGDYTKDGLLFCGKCHTPKQCRQSFMGHKITVGCLCRCATEARDREAATRRKQEEADKVMRLRSSGISSQEFRNARFLLDDGQSPGPMGMLKRYAEQWNEMFSQNIGLLLWGGVGTGKSFGAACIANALIEQSIPACMVNLSSVLNSLTNFQGMDRNQFIGDLMKYPLLILDDFGMERKTEFANEQIFNVIDERYRSGKPLIVTTNIPLASLKAPGSLEMSRISDRILEMCTPVGFGDRGRRQAKAAEKMQRAATLLKG